MYWNVKLHFWHLIKILSNAGAKIVRPGMILPSQVQFPGRIQDIEREYSHGILPMYTYVCKNLGRISLGVLRTIPF